jgi:hypothetical protein
MLERRTIERAGAAGCADGISRALRDAQAPPDQLKVRSTGPDPHTS